MAIESDDWKVNIKTKRFVLFFDILGFKDLVLHNSHDDIFLKLTTLKDYVNRAGELKGEDIVSRMKESSIYNDYIKGFDEEFSAINDQTRSITFSDSIIIFSKGDTVSDATKIIMDAQLILEYAFTLKIPIKGAISFGEISVDFEKSIFFGQPIIDAYLLHEDLKQLSVILDHSSEKKLKSLKLPNIIKRMLISYSAYLKYGRVTHTLLGIVTSKPEESYLSILEHFYLTVSGQPRIYIDNTIEYTKSLIVSQPKL